MLKIDSANGPGGLAFPALRGMSAYEIAVKHGFQGTEKEWLESIAHGQPDWNQNDPTAKDYIKNRPFYCDEVWSVVFEQQVFWKFNASTTAAGYEYAMFDSTDSTVFALYPVGTTCKAVVDGEVCIGTITENAGALYFGNGSLWNTDWPDTGESFVFVSITSTRLDLAAKTGLSVNPSVSMYVRIEAPHKLDSKYLPDEVAARKPLLLDANLSDYYGGHPEAGDEALEAIKTGRQILVRVPNRDLGTFVASYSPIYFYQLPRDGQYLYLFYLRDEKQDLSELLGQPAGSVLLPTYGQFQMLLSKYYNSNPLDP